MQVVVFSKMFRDTDLPYVQALFDALHEENINAFVFRPYLEQLRGKIALRREVGIFENYQDFFVKQLDYCITLGGDGTILNALLHIRDSNVPIMGINLGRLGFLAGIEKKRIAEAVRLLRKGMFDVENRSMLYLESNLPVFGACRFALNDCTLLKRDTSSMITIHTFVNGAYLNSYWADGVIVSTPTGSTGYSLSCGGPIMFPDSNTFVITPVAPHNLNIRPIVISEDAVISFEVEGRSENFLCSLDSRSEVITAAHQLAVRKNDFGIRLIRIPGAGFLETMREKLNWGADKRND